MRERWRGCCIEKPANRTPRDGTREINTLTASPSLGSPFGWNQQEATDLLHSDQPPGPQGRKEKGTSSWRATVRNPIKRMSTAAWFIKPKGSNSPNAHQLWIHRQNVVSAYNRILFRQRRKEELTPATVRMNLEDVMLSERNPQKTTYCRIPCIWNVQKRERL